MTRQRSVEIISLVLLLAGSTLAQADAPTDLRDGQAAAAKGDLAAALPLLTAAAQGLPDSVEAQLALAECHLKLGRLDDALAQYRRVLALSPDHAQAKQIVAALTGNAASFDEQLQIARALRDVAAYDQAVAVLGRAIAQPVATSQRDQARLLLAEVRLWQGQGDLALAIALAQESSDPKVSAPARVVAALTLLSQPAGSRSDAERLIAQTGELDAPWSDRLALAKTWLELERTNDHATVSAKLSQALTNVPPSPLRELAIDRWQSTLLSAAKERSARGELDTALAILWPMVSAQPLPKSDAVLKPFEVSGGWLYPVPNASGPASERAINRTLQVSRSLADVGNDEFTRKGRGASLLGYWLAGEVLRSLPDRDERTGQTIVLATELAGLSRSAPDHHVGDPLSVADQIQRQLVLQAAGDRVSEKNRNNVATQLVALAVAQVARYEPVKDWETGLAQFAVVDLDAKPPLARLISPLDQMPLGEPHARLLNYVALSYATLGRIEFDVAAAQLSPDANQTLNRFDTTSLLFARQIAAAYPGDSNCRACATGIVNRYAAASQWPAAEHALALFYEQHDAEAGRWELIALMLRHSGTDEGRLLAANRQLAKDLSPLVKEAIAEIHAALKANATKPTRERAATIAASLVDEYEGLNRLDIAEAVLAAVAAEPDGAALADWAIWTRAGLRFREASLSFALALRNSGGQGNIPLQAAHQAELKLLDELIEKFPQSDYRGAAVNRVPEIAATYRDQRSFNVAATVLTSFLKTHPKLSAAERFEFEIVQTTIAEARDAFSRRENPDDVPDKISEQYLVAIAAIAAFLEKHPTGEFSPAAENELFQIARSYAHAGGWLAARDVLQRFAAAIPDYRHPDQLRLLEAATYLGELDRDYGLDLMTLNPAPPAPQPPTGGGIGGLASTENSGNLFGNVESGGPSWNYSNGYGASGMNAPPGSGPAAAATAQPYGHVMMDPSLPTNGQPSQPGETALAMIRQSQRRQVQQIAMLENEQLDLPFSQQPFVQLNASAGQSSQAISLPGGSVLSEAEMKRQDDAADKAYAILIELVKNQSPAQIAVSDSARARILWLFGFFEGQLRANRAIALIDRYLTDQPADPAKVALAFQAINDRLSWASQHRSGDRIALAWLDERHELFDKARKTIDAFITANKDQRDWINRARMLNVVSYDREAQLAGAVSAIRAGGLLVRSVAALLDLLEAAPDHPSASDFPARIWNVADRLQGLSQNEQAIYVLSQIPIRFPIDNLANQSVLRVAELHAANLSNPLKAVDSYQEYLSLNGDGEQVRSQIFSIAQQLAAQRRYLEGIHVFGVFVDSFPTDPRAPEALRSIGQTHQANEVWDEAMAVYERILDEYPGVEIVPQVKLAIAECHINLSHWRDARRIYEEYVQQYPGDGQSALAGSRTAVLKNLERYQTLLADDLVQRNKDDAQFQIGRIVLQQLQNQVKAIAEFRKVVVGYPKSDLADDAQLEVGRALLALGRLDEARAALLEVPRKFPNSPVADDALYLAGQSYEQQAQQLASVTAARAREEAFERNQRGAYQSFNEQLAEQGKKQSLRRDELKKAGKVAELGLDEAANAFRFNGANYDTISNTARQAESQAETESALQVANRQDRINEAYREAVALYAQSASDYPLGDKTDDSLLRIAQILELNLKDRAKAMQTYQEIVKLFPGTPVAEDAAWKVAQFYEQEGNYAAAADAYREFIRNYPASARVADAQFALAEVFEQLGRWVDAMDAYETFRQKFGEHPKAQMAAEQINWIKAYRK